MAATTFQVKVTGTETDTKVKKNADCTGGKGYRDQIKIKYVIVDTGQEDEVVGIVARTVGQTDWESANDMTETEWDETLSKLGINTWTDMDGNVAVQYWSTEDSGDPDYKCPVQKTITALKGGLNGDTGTTTETGGTVASDLGTSTMYFASLGDNVEIGSESGLIRNGTFSLKWNKFESTSEWNDGTKGRYNSIEDGEVSGSMTIIKENVYDYSTLASFNTYYDLNTGTSQTSPTMTLIGGSGGKEFDVEYGNVELNAIENKYKRFDGSWNNAVESMIDELVQVAIDGSYQTRAGLNFKKTRAKEFKEKDITVFVGETMEGTAEETGTEQSMETGITTTTTTTSISTATEGGY